MPGMSRRRRWLLGMGGVALAAALVALLSEAVRIDMEDGAVARIFDAQSAPPRELAIVLGAPLGRLLEYRMDAACALVARGTAQRLLLTGTTEEMPYMRARAEACLSADRVLVDDRAERTWDNLKNARERFGVAQALVVTQRFHLPRALFLAETLGIDAVGVVAPGEPRAWGYWRERFARLRALLDRGA